MASGGRGDYAAEVVRSRTTVSTLLDFHELPSPSRGNDPVLKAVNHGGLGSNPLWRVREILTSASASAHPRAAFVSCRDNEPRNC